MKSMALRTCGFLLVFASMAGMAHATIQETLVPEIDPGSATSALALLSGGALMLIDRFRRK